MLEKGRVSSMRKAEQEVVCTLMLMQRGKGMVTTMRRQKRKVSMM
jgi:hypothetical protein